MNIIKKFKCYFKCRTNDNDITLDEAKEMMKNNNKIVLLDVRSPQEYEEGHLDSAIVIPLYELKCKAYKTIRR